MPDSLRQKAKKTFSGFGVAGKRSFSVLSDSIFYGSEIDSRLDQRSTRAFSSSLGKSRGNNQSPWSQLPTKLAEPKGLEKSCRIFKLLKKYNPQVFSDEYVIVFDRPGSELGRILVKKANESYKASGIFNSACIIDPFGNVLLAESGAQDKSPIRTPFMDLIHKYHKLVFDVGHEGRKYFAQIKY